MSSPIVRRTFLASLFAPLMPWRKLTPKPFAVPTFKFHGVDSKLHDQFMARPLTGFAMDLQREMNVRASMAVEQMDFELKRKAAALIAVT